MNKAIVLILVMAGCCNMATAQFKTIKYTEDTTDFPNPERGFYIAMHTKAGGMDTAELIKLRTIESIKSSNANYTARITLVYKGYLLTAFRNEEISSEFLQLLQQDFDAIRIAGLKMVIRFSYTDKSTAGDCPDKGICPPYGDAPKAIVLQHIAQLKPLLMANADVIAVAQQGFIGIWGENFYTDYFGDESKNNTGYMTDSNWNDRNQVLKALLDALPKSRMVQVRTPRIRQRFVYGPRASISSSPMMDNEAFTATDKSRIALHNDCFLSSADDYGTFDDNGNSPEPKVPAMDVLRKYWIAESRYVAVGGETCDNAFSPQNDCAPWGHAVQEMASMHYSFLNVSYNNLVNNDWQTQGCMAAIKKKLGYRFVLQQAILPVKLHATVAMPIAVTLINEGFASPYNPRQLQLILRNKLSGKVIAIPLQTNVQRWFTGKVEIKQAIKLPGNIEVGEYELLLDLPDESASLKGRPEYSIRFANKDCWEEKTGYNKLNHVVVIER